MRFNNYFRREKLKTLVCENQSLDSLGSYHMLTWGEHSSSSQSSPNSRNYPKPKKVKIKLGKIEKFAGSGEGGSPQRPTKYSFKYFIYLFGQKVVKIQ